MDADTRHQLKQNEFAEALQRLRDFSDKRTLGWLAAILIVALGFAAYKVWVWRQQVHLVESCQMLINVVPADTSRGDAPLATLRELIADDPQPGLVALARLQLAQGLEARGQEPDGAAKLAEAEKQYQAVIDMPAAPDQLKATATYRLGILYETTREFTKAREIYTSLSQNQQFTGSPFIEFAAARLEQLDKLITPIAFEPGLKPLPTTQPASQPVGPPLGPTLDSIQPPPRPTIRPLEPKGMTPEPTSTQPSEPQQP
jgi:predicted negative regulator of RcsB-dependent stress response